MKKTVLFVPGFVVDVYSEIEASFIDLCAAPNRTIDFLWLVPSIDGPANRFARPESRGALREPVWVEQLRRHNIPYVVADIHPWDAVHNYRVFRQLFREHDIDAVYTHFGVERFWATMFGKLFGKTTIWNEHWHSLGTRFTLPKRLFYRLFVDSFISVSGYIARTLPASIPTHTILNAIHGDAPAPADKPREERRTTLGLPATGPVVLMVAEFRPDKRHFVALDVCRDVAAHHPDTVFVFLGDGALRQEFLRRASAAGLKHVISPGHVDNVDDYYDVADVCMLTSHNEPFGYCVLEAMKFGVPMVAFNAAGPAEILQNQKTGALVEECNIGAFAREVVRLIDDPPLRARIGANARKAVRDDFSRAVWIKALVSAMNDILRDPPGSAPKISLN